MSKLNKLERLDQRTLDFILYLRALGVSTYKISQKINGSLSQSTVWWVCKTHETRVRQLQDSLRRNLLKCQAEIEEPRDFARDELEETRSYRPCSPLEFGGGLGSVPLNKFELYSILKHSPSCSKNLGLRVRELKQKQFLEIEEPTLKRLKQKCSDILKSLNLAFVGTETYTVVGAEIGRLAEKYYEEHLRRRKNTRLTPIAIGVVLFALRSYVPRSLTILKVDSKVLRKVERIADVSSQRV